MTGSGKRNGPNTTVVHTDGDRGRGRGLLLGIVLLLLVGLLLYFLLGRGDLNEAADEVGVNVNVEAPDLKMPDVDVPDVTVPDVDVPDVNINVPEVNVDADAQGQPKKQ